jgi:hypothetical protein
MFKIEGLVAAVFTPFNEDGSLNFELIPSLVISLFVGLVGTYLRKLLVIKTVEKSSRIDIGIESTRVDERFATNISGDFNSIKNNVASYNIY